MLEAIVGIEIAVERLEGKAKLSQNRETHDRLGAAGALIERGATELGDSMLRSG